MSTTLTDPPMEEVHDVERFKLLKEQAQNAVERLEADCDEVVDRYRASDLYVAWERECSRRDAFELVSTSFDELAVDVGRFSFRNDELNEVGLSLDEAVRRARFALDTSEVSGEMVRSRMALVAARNVEQWAQEQFEVALAERADAR